MTGAPGRQQGSLLHGVPDGVHCSYAHAQADDHGLLLKVPDVACYSAAALSGQGCGLDRAERCLAGRPDCSLGQKQ